jgi:hypothetical protein
VPVSACEHTAAELSADRGGDVEGYCLSASASGMSRLLPHAAVPPVRLRSVLEMVLLLSRGAGVPRCGPLALD